MAYAIVFSGGGALGSWEVGCYDHLLSAHNSEQPTCVTGASAGALNAAAICAGMTVDQIRSLWIGLDDASVFTSRIPKLATAAAMGRCVAQRSWAPLLKFADSQTSLLDTAPLAQTLSKIFNGYEAAFLGSPLWFAVSLTNLTTKTKEMFYKVPPGASLPGYFQQAALPKERPPVWQPVTSYKILEQALMGTTALPILFPPFQSYFDGGVLLNQPISPAIQIMDALLNPRDTDSTPLDIYVLIPDPEALGTTAGLLSIANTALSAWLSASLLAQITTVKWRNMLRMQSGQGAIRLCVVRPSRDLPAGLLDFGKNVEALIDQGRTDCADRLSRFDSANENSWY